RAAARPETTGSATTPTPDRRAPSRRGAGGDRSRQLRLELCEERHRLGTCQLRGDDRSGHRSATGGLLERPARMEALHEGRDERVAGAEAVDDLHGMAWDVDLGPSVEQQHAALAALEHECGDAEVEERLRVTRGGFDLLLVADDDVRVPCGAPYDLAVRAGLFPQRRPPVEVQDREVLVCLERG